MDLWQEDTPSEDSAQAPVSDIVFQIKCDRLPVDHAQALGSAVEKLVPWLCETDGAGVHPIYVAGSQNGWERPNKNSGEDLILSKRTKLTIRVGQSDSARLIESLSSQSIELDGYEIKVLGGRQKPLQASTTLYSRNVFFKEANNADDDEGSFVNAVVKWCMERGVKPTRLLSGKTDVIEGVDGQLVTRSVLLGNISLKNSLMLQSTGIGEHRLIGCGILVPHKSTNAVHDPTD